MKSKIILSAILMAFVISNTNAQAVKRARHQHQRIRQGVASGELTKAEAVNLRNDQKEIRQDAKDAKADGVVTAEERKNIRQDQRKESRKILRKKHNNRDRN